MDNQQLPLRLCSGCAGDYEDPDWTAWDQDPTEEQELIDLPDNAPPKEVPEPQ